MADPLCRVLILDSDPDTLITLQRVFEDADIDTTVTWDEAEARQLLQTAPYDCILIGDHPPELNAAAILDDLSFRGTCPSAMILRAATPRHLVEHFHRLGATGVIPRGNPVAILEQLTKALAPLHSKAKPKSVLPATRVLRAAS
jgi:CheY-like chemotaxis protein